MSDPRAPSVSVVVPVYNPGPWIEPCIRSILGQTLPRSELEAIFVDDGSTDGTAERLDRLAADEPGVTVIHIPPSGAPGRPRNVGISAARGTYIQFLDADDELAPDALERLLAMARRNHSDIVVGRFVSETLPRAQDLFERSVEACTVADSPELLGGSLGPTKLFRTGFIRAQRLAFPEGWLRMEDQAFTLQAFLRARVISLLGGSACYRFNRRSDAGNLSLQPVDPQRHVEAVDHLLELAEAETRPGALRDRVMRRVLGAEVLARIEDLGERGPLDPSRSAMVAALADLARRHISDRLAGRLTPLQRVEADVLREGDAGRVAALARQIDRVVIEQTVARATWRNGRLTVELAARLMDSTTRTSLAIECVGPVARLNPTFGDVLDGSMTVPGARSRGRLAVLIRHRSLVEHLADTIASTDARSGAAPSSGQDGTCWIAGRARLDLGGRARMPEDLPPGRWDIVARLDWLGFRRRAALLAGEESSPGPEYRLPGPAIIGRAGRVVVPFVDAAGLAIDVDRTTTSLADALIGRPVTVLGDGVRLVLGLEIATGTGTAALAAEIVLRSPGGEHVLSATLRPAQGMTRLEADVRHARPSVPAGRYAVVARLDGPTGPELPIGDAVVGAGGRTVVSGPRRVPASVQRRAALQWAARRTGEVLVERGRAAAASASPHAERLARRIVARSPQALQDRAEAVYRRVRRR